jgi:hypothetical protein
MTRLRRELKVHYLAGFPAPDGRPPSRPDRAGDR